MNNISVNQVNIPDLNIDFVRSLPRVEFLDRKELPFDKGLYFVCVDYPVFQVLYIGCTTNFRSRWDRHNKQEEFKVLQVVQPVWIYYLVMNWQKEDMEILEYAAIRKLSPSLNVRGIDNDIFIVSRISKTEKELILSEISKPLEEHSSDELISILERLGIVLLDNSKPKYWMIGAIKKCLYGINEFNCKIEANFSEKRRQDALVKSLKKVNKPPVIKEILTDVNLSVARTIDPCAPDSYSEITIRTMKKLASMLNVCGYSVMTKDELAHKISLAAKHLDPLK